MFSSFKDMVLSHAPNFFYNTKHKLQSFNTTYGLKNTISITYVCSIYDSKNTISDAYVLRTYDSKNMVRR